MRLYDFGETEDGVPFIAWELLEGRPLEAVIDAEAPLAPPRVARIAIQILKSLMEAHQHGIVHRDLKPANVFLCAFPGETDFVKVLDFGLAKNTLSRAATRMTPAGSILGTPGYMSPEQVKAAAVGPASDLFSLGLMMAEMITGKRVFPGSSPWDVINDQLAERPTPLAPAVLASPLGAIVARATERSLERRYRSASEMLQDLEALGATSAAPVPSAAPPPAAPRSAALPSAALPSAALSPPSVSAAPAPPSHAPVPTMVSPGAAGPASAPPVAPAPPVRGSRSVILLAAAGGALIAVGLLLGGLYAAGVLGGSSGAAPAAARASAPASGEPFAGLDNKQIRARIEAAHYKVVVEDGQAAASTWVLAGANGSYVQLTRLDDLKNAEALEQALLKGAGATARDGTTVLHVQLPQSSAARALLAQIVR